MESCTTGIFNLLHDIVKSNNKSVALCDLQLMADWQAHYTDMDPYLIARIVNVFGTDVKSVPDLSYLGLSTDVISGYMEACVENPALMSLITCCVNARRSEWCISSIVNNVDNLLAVDVPYKDYIADSQYSDELVVEMVRSIKNIEACAAAGNNLLLNISTATTGKVLSTVADCLRKEQQCIPLKWMRDGFYRSTHAACLCRLYAVKPALDWAKVLPPSASVLATKEIMCQYGLTTDDVRSIVNKYAEVSPRLEYALVKIKRDPEYRDMTLYAVYAKMVEKYGCAGEDLLEFIGVTVPVTLQKYQDKWLSDMKCDNHEQDLNSIL